MGQGLFVQRYGGLIHGFMNLAGLVHAARDAFDEATWSLSRALSTGWSAT